MEHIEHDGQLLAIVCRDEDWQRGLTFPTPGHLFIQAGCWWYPAGKDLAAHYHKENVRTASRTQELTYIKKGRMKVSLYNEHHEHVRDVILETGDFAVMIGGGHGYQILDDDTQVLEVKNGPFIDVETDKAPITRR